jgi:hypothetical protein
VGVSAMLRALCSGSATNRNHGTEKPRTYAVLIASPVGRMISSMHLMPVDSMNRSAAFLSGDSTWPTATARSLNDVRNAELIGYRARTDT